jgi:hypothetical protein
VEILRYEHYKNLLDVNLLGRGKKLERNSKNSIYRQKIAARERSERLPRTRSKPQLGAGTTE